MTFMRHATTVFGPVRACSYRRSQTYHLSGQSQENWSHRTVCPLLVKVVCFTRFRSPASCRMDGQVIAKACVEPANERVLDIRAYSWYPLLLHPPLSQTRARTLMAHKSSSGRSTTSPASPTAQAREALAGLDILLISKLVESSKGV